MYKRNLSCWVRNGWIGTSKGGIGYGVLSGRLKARGPLLFEESILCVIRMVFRTNSGIFLCPLVSHYARRGFESELKTKRSLETELAVEFVFDCAHINLNQSLGRKS